MAAIASWTDSGAAAGSPVPPMSRQVARENWYLPRYRPEADTAVGSPPDSHWAILASVEEPPPPLGACVFVCVLAGADEAAMPRLESVAGPAMPSTARPWLRW